jgi:hypothetical protein
LSSDTTDINEICILFLALSLAKKNSRFVLLLLGIVPKLDLPVGHENAGAVTHLIVEINPS